ncbi:hypothetical protein NDI76_11355 [Halogeometricum sp. S1BR25-6]|uniref:CARDB domain-containing protein n=1 Tax=Halogeometricum salsisoli TaxID=2950536 RepID=A0ABU2GGC1_9EURY|nr:hypothetical protein [Halogeometricum sp. S1BR25-6]MDS0299338.1 hypothetical protein [Halogeometricum sp. S1BR25-6]
MSHRYTGDDDDEESEAFDQDASRRSDDRRSGEDVDSDTTVTSREASGAGTDAASSPDPADGSTADEAAAEKTDADESGAHELPPILDVRDALDRIERESDADVSDQLDRVRSLLDEYEGREADASTSQASLVDDVDGVVVSMRERLSGDADRLAEGIENRLQIYRDSRSDASETLYASGAGLSDNGGDVESAKAVRGEAVTLEATLVNQGEPRDGAVRLTFYDESNAPVLRVERRETDLRPDDNRQVSQRVFVPEEAEYFDVTALDAAETAASASTNA